MEEELTQNEGGELPVSPPQINIDNSEVSIKLQEILDEVRAERENRQKEKEASIKKEEEELKDLLKKEEEKLKNDEQYKIEKDEFLENIKILTENSDIAYQTELSNTMIERLEEQNFTGKMNIAIISVVIAILLVNIFADSFRR